MFDLAYSLSCLIALISLYYYRLNALYYVLNRLNRAQNPLVVPDTYLTATEAPRPNYKRTSTEQDYAPRITPHIPTDLD